MYGICVNFGKGVAVNHREAHDYYVKGAELGDPGCFGMAGQIHESGVGGFTRDMQEAAKWYEKGAERGDARSLYRLGKFYAAGNGRPKDLVKARKLLERAKDLRFKGAEQELAKLPPV
jgi:TPR repeat protein